MSYKFDSEVLKALEELLETETNYDVIIYVEKEWVFHAHSGFLCCRSKYFNSIISAKNFIDGKYIISMPNKVTHQAFDVIITYFYTGHINMINKTVVEILNIMIAFEVLKLNQLIKLAEDYLIEQHDPVEILQIIYSHEIFNDNIQKSCLKIIYSEPNILFDSVKFINLPAPLLEIILKRDGILDEIDEMDIMNEIEIWENLIKWGLAKDKILDEDVSKWNQEKFNIFEKILHDFIPLIRFYKISSEDYYNKVRPYEQILPKELREEILKFNMVPTRYKSSRNKYTESHLINTITVDSLFINKAHIALFANWIERKDNYYRVYNYIPYEFNLILRGSRDGFDSKSFHNKCDNKGATITIIKIKNSNQIVGGYNPLSWSVRIPYDDLGVQSSIPDSFLFSFNDNRNVGSGIISRPINNNGTVISDPNCGPNFGNDLYMQSRLCFYRPKSYTDINIPKFFGIDDYEVFQVKKKFYSKL